MKGYGRLSSYSSGTRPKNISAMAAASWSASWCSSFASVAHTSRKSKPVAARRGTQNAKARTTRIISTLFMSMSSNTEKEQRYRSPMGDKASRGMKVVFLSYYLYKKEWENVSLWLPFTAFPCYLVGYTHAIREKKA